MPSGRRPYIEELELKKVSNLALATVKSLLMRNDLTVDQQLRLTLPILLKRLPDKIDAQVTEIKKQIILVRNEQALAEFERQSGAQIPADA